MWHPPECLFYKSENGCKIGDSARICAFLEVIHSFPEVGCARNKLLFLTVQQNLSLDTGLRMDGLPALELWDLIVSVSGNISHVSDRTGQPVNGKNKSYNKIDVMQVIDSVPSNVQSASREALLYVFEDNEAVIKMIMKGRSPTMRRVSRTHRVALDWLFDRINLDPKIQTKYIDTKNQLEDMLTKGIFTRDELTHLMCLFNISLFSSIKSLEAMSKRTQEDAGEESHSKIKADDEFGIEMPCKGPDRACLNCI